MMPALDYLAAISDCLIISGYLFGKICSNTFNSRLVGSVFILLGYSVAFLADAFAILDQLVNVRECCCDFTINKYLAISNILSIIGLYKELKTALRAR